MVISVATGLLIGAIDAFGFFYTVKLFFAKSNGFKKALAGTFELFRLAILVTVILFLASHKIVMIVPLFLTALFVSMSGKMILVIKGLNK